MYTRRPSGPLPVGRRKTSLLILPDQRLLSSRSRQSLFRLLPSAGIRFPRTPRARTHTHTRAPRSYQCLAFTTKKEREMARSFSIKQAPQQTKRSPEAAASREPGSYSSSRRTRGPRQVVAIAARSAPSAATDRWQAGPVDIGNYSISPSWWGPSRRSFSVL